MRLLRDPDPSALGQQHPDGNLQSPSGWVNDTDRPIPSLRSAKDLQGSTVKRVKGIEDLNLCIIRAQGIVGVGAITRTCTAWFRKAASPPMARGGFGRATTSSFQSSLWRKRFAENFAKLSKQRSRPANYGSRVS